MPPLLNYKHLRYFWMVATTGSVARAAAQLHLTPQSISGQLGSFERKLGVKLFHRSGRSLELTEAGRRILRHAEQIFALGDELLGVLHDEQAASILPFNVGIADSVAKSTCYRLIEPALELGHPVRLVCREGRLAALLAELAVHRLDIVIADRPMPSKLNVRGYSHLLGESSMTVFGTAGLCARSTRGFPEALDGAPFLLPGEDVAIRQELMGWFETRALRPRIVGEFDDAALLKAFGQAGAGFFVAPTLQTGQVCEQYQVQELGRIEEVRERLYAITTERRVTHPAILAINRRAWQFGEAPAAT
jgi:LysR family transcriptional activator of nhaA